MNLGLTQWTGGKEETDGLSLRSRQHFKKKKQEAFVREVDFVSGEKADGKQEVGT